MYYVNQFIATLVTGYEWTESIRSGYPQSKEFIQSYRTTKSQKVGVVIIHVHV
jgi:hypothetical protein